jgi:pyridoxamine 5'-phosphate oxidase-like protein
LRKEIVVATWQEFAAADPDLAVFGGQRLMGRVAYLATIRADGAPRVHPLTPHIGEGHLFVYMDPTSPKGHDLRRDGRYALHCSVEDRNGGEGEFSIRGQAKVIDEPTIRTLLFEAARADGSNPQDRYIIFELSIESASSVVYEDGEPIRKHWKAT